MRQITWTLDVAGKRDAFCLPQPCRLITVGKDRADIPVFSSEPVRLQCVLSADGVRVRGDGETRIKPNGYPDGEFMTETDIREDAELIVGTEKTPECFRLIITFAAEEQQPVYDRQIELMDGEFTFGSRVDNTVGIPTVGSARTAFALSCTDGRVTVSARDVPLGVYLNDTRLFPGQETELKKNDYLFTAGSCFIYTGDKELFTTADADVRGLNYRDRSDSISHLVYPHMIRTSRYHYTIPTKPIEVLDPPRLQDQPKQNVLMSIVPVVAMLLLVLLMRGSGGMSMMFMSVGMMGVGAITSVYTILREKKEYRGKKEKRLKDYREYIEERENYIRKSRQNEQEVLNRVYISSMQEIRNIREFSPELFDRTMTDQDFLHIRFGYGRLLSGQQVKPQDRRELGNDDELIKEPERLKTKYCYNEQMPAIVEGTKANAIGVLGDLGSLKRMMNIITLDLTTRHLPDEMELYLLCDRDFDDQLNAYRFFPHVWNSHSNRRNIACDEESRNALLEELYKRLADREAADKPDEKTSWIVIYVHSDSETMQHPLMNFIGKAAELHTLFIFWSQQREEQPIGCSAAVRLFSNENGGVIVDTFDKNPDQPFSYETVADEVMEESARRLSPVYVSEVSLAGRLTSHYTLYDTLRLNTPEASSVLANWRACSTQQSLAVPIGITGSGDPQILDLHEKAHGPHGLVAGTTGSGKSEVIISYLMSLAWYFSPEDINIVIIDFKGGGMGNQLEGLPHLTGVITNLGAGELERSLASIKAELIVRQQMLADAKVANISDYTREYKAGRLAQPMPHLLLVVDEFAELKAQQPDFMDELISAARIGRSLGVHLILSTQKPFGVVNDQILSNMDFYLCLRVQTREDSNEMLKSPLAAEIREPGRAYIKVNRCGMFQLFQSGYSGGSISDTDEVQSTFQISEVSLAGKRTVLYQYAPPKDDNGQDGSDIVVTQFMTVKQAIEDAWKRAGLQQPRRICQPPLPTEKTWEQRETENRYLLPVGTIDLPDQQKLIPLLVDLNGENILIAGGSQMGKTTMLQTIVRAASEGMDGRDVCFYIMDFNSGVFKTMESMSVIGGVAAMDEEEKIRNLIRMMTEEIAFRKEKLLERSVLTFEAYCGSGDSDLPAIALLIDNFAVFRELYDERYDAEMMRIMRDGPSVGISVIITTTDAASMGFRRMCYFSTRYAFHCGDDSEYSTILDGTRRKLGEIPGRVLLRLDKEIVEAQIDLPYAGTTETERAQAGREYIASKQVGAHARKIPGIPAVLTAEALKDMFGEPFTASSLLYGMSYGDVEPVKIDLANDFELALVGTPKTGSADKTLLHYLMRTLAAHQDKVHIRIVDGYDKVLRPYQDLPNVTYTQDAAQAPVFVKEAAQIARDRFDIADEKGAEALNALPAEVIILTGTECLKQISDDDECMNTYEILGSRYRQMKIFFLFAGLENKTVSYNAPKLLRHLKEARRAICFENAAQIKMFDLTLSETRENRDRLGRDDAFFLTQDEMQRIRLASADT